MLRIRHSSVCSAWRSALLLRFRVYEPMARDVIIRVAVRRELAAVVVPSAVAPACPRLSWRGSLGSLTFPDSTGVE